MPLRIVISRTDLSHMEFIPGWILSHSPHEQPGYSYPLKSPSSI